MADIKKDKFIVDVSDIISEYDSEGHDDIALRIWMYLQSYRFKF